MNTQRIKTLCAIASLALAQLTAHEVYVHLQQRSDPAGSVSEEALATALSDVRRTPNEPSKTVSYEAIRRGYQAFNWTGALPVGTPSLLGTDEQEEVYLPVSELIHVLMLRVDTDDSRESIASISYQQAANFPPRMAAAGQDLRVGDTLLAPHAWAKVVRVTLDGIEFEFDEDGRENELVAPALATSGDTRVIQLGAKLPSARSTRTALRITTETHKLRTNHFHLGTNDRKQLATDYPTILSRDVRHRRHFNSRTRKYDGIEIQSVTPGSFAARHGAETGDIIRSINDQPVTSVAEAVAFVRAHQSGATTWQVEIENQGRLRTVTYEVPANE